MHRLKFLIYLAVEALKVSGEDAPDAVHLLWQEGAAVGARIHSKACEYEIQ